MKHFKIFVGIALVVSTLVVAGGGDVFGVEPTLRGAEGWIMNLVIGCSLLISAQIDKLDERS